MRSGGDTVLLVMRGGGARSLAARVLGRLGAVRVARDAYEASALFGAEGASLVVASLGRWRRPDLGFVAAVRARDPRVPILLLVPDGARALAIEGLRRGADAYVLEPFDPDELAAIASRLRARAKGTQAAGGSGAGAVARLSGEVAHAVNNPLQVMSLLLEEAAETGAAPASWVERLRGEVERVRAALGVLADYGGLPRPAAVPTDLGALLRDRAEDAVRRGLVRASEARSPLAYAMADAQQVGRAMDAVLRFLAARSRARPAPVRIAVRRGRRPGPPRVEAAVLGSGVALGATEVPEALDAVLLTDERTREPYPGLALPRAVAEAHGGSLRLRETERGAVVGLVLPGSAPAGV
jgi:DNA-binding NarL/FixJ family response regulator